MSLRTWLILLVAAACGCSSGEPTGGSGTGGMGGPPPPIAGLKSIDVTPHNQTLAIEGATPATQIYQATGTFDDGHQEDVTGRVGFRLSDLSLGSFTGPRFKSQLDHGGITSVVAEAGSVQGSTGLTLLFRQRRSDPGSTNLPPNPGGPFGGPPNAGRAPQLIYPNDGVLLPPNLGQLEFHFYGGNGNTLYELSFANVTTDIRVYLRCTNPLNGGCIYQADPVVWHWIAETNRGRQPLSVTLRGTDDSGTGVGTSNLLTMSFSQDNINGGLYYWTTSNGTAIMRFDFAAPGQTVGTKFLGTELTGG